MERGRDLLATPPPLVRATGHGEPRLGVWYQRGSRGAAALHARQPGGWRSAVRKAERAMARQLELGLRHLAGGPGLHFRPTVRCCHRAPPALAAGVQARRTLDCPVGGGHGRLHRSAPGCAALRGGVQPASSSRARRELGRARDVQPLVGACRCRRAPACHAAQAARPLRQPPPARPRFPRGPCAGAPIPAVGAPRVERRNSRVRPVDAQALPRGDGGHARLHQHLGLPGPRRARASRARSHLPARAQPVGILG
mmetsp:Transcript_11182/g.35348  ORF Transcript_11182/g.35348 Transcript_11182/m.35348 type:complete len:254 (+) Transcript_11182:2378-3139(+)